MKKCRITVLQTQYNEELVKEYIKIPDFGLCPVFKEGEEFYTSGPFGIFMPNGFCEPAWDAIGKIAVALATGGEIFGDKVNIACCNDGARTVIFKLEAVDI